MKINILLDEFCQYATHFKGFNALTTGRYKKVVEFFMRSVQIADIEQATEEKIRQYFFHGRTKRNWSATTFVTYYKTLKVFFRYCVEHKYIAASPVTDIELPKEQKKLPTKLSKQDALKLLEIIYNYPYQHNNRFERARNHAIFSTLIFTGVRKNELLNLNYSDIDLENMTMLIRQGKGAKDRFLPIPQTLADSLNKYLEERHRLKKTCPNFFVSLHRNMRFTDSGLKRLVDKFAQASNIKFTIHKLRHTFATLMLEGGVDIYSLSKMLGHSEISTTTIYLSATAEHLRGQMMKHPLNI